MAAKKNKSSEIKILRQDFHNINGYSYRLDGCDFVPATKIYFRKERCLDLSKSSKNNIDLDLDSMSVYDNFMSDIQDIIKGRTVKSLEGLPTTNLTMTILESEVNLKKEFDEYRSNNKKGTINSHIAETLNYLFGDGNTKKKTKRIIESIKKNTSLPAKPTKIEQKLFDEEGKIIVAKKRGRKKTEEIPQTEPKEKKKRGRPPMNKLPFRVFVPDKNKQDESKDELSVESVPVPSVSAPSSLTSRPSTRKKRPASQPKPKKFSAFADTYTPLNQVENSEVVEYMNLEILPQSLLATVKTDLVPTSGSSKQTNKEIIEQFFVRLYQSVLLAKMRYENGDQTCRSLYESDICKIYVNLMCELLKMMGVPEDQEHVDEYFKGMILKTYDGQYKYELKGQESIFSGGKVADHSNKEKCDKVILSITDEKSKPTVSKLLSTNSLGGSDSLTVLMGNVMLKLNEYDDKKTFDKIIQVTKEILSDGPKAGSYYQFLSFVADTILPDESNLEDIKTKIPFDLLFLADSEIKDQEKIKLVKLFTPLKVQIDLIKEDVSNKDVNSETESNIKDESLEPKGGLRSTTSETHESNDFIDYNEIFSDSVLKKLGIRDFNGKTSDDLKMEAEFNECKAKEEAKGTVITEEVITRLINQVAATEASLIFLEGSEKIKKGRKIKKNYVLPPKPLPNSHSYTQEIKKYNAAKDYLKDPAYTSLRVVCQQNKISVPTLITYMDAGRVSRMMVTGRYSGSTVIRDSSFNNRGKSLYPEEIKGVFLQKTYEQLLEAKRCSLKCNIPNESKLSARLSIAKHELFEEMKKNAGESNPELINEHAPKPSSQPSSSLADVSGNTSVTTTASSEQPETKKYLNHRVDKLSVKYPVLRLPFQQALASDVINANTKSELADIIKVPILDIVKADHDVVKQIDFEYLTLECIYSMSNTVAAVVNSNFDFGNFLGGVFKKKKSNLFKRHPVSKPATKSKVSDGTGYSKDKSCFRLIQFKET